MRNIRQISGTPEICRRGWPAKQVGRGAVSGFNRLAHGVKNQIAVAEHEIVGKAKHAKALAPQEGIASLVVGALLRSIMRNSIELHDHPRLRAEKVDDVGSNRHLPLELVAMEAANPNLLPEQILGPRQDRALLLGE